MILCWDNMDRIVYKKENGRFYIKRSSGKLVRAEIRICDYCENDYIQDMYSESRFCGNSCQKQNYWSDEDNHPEHTRGCKSESERSYSHNLKRKYGITFADYKEMLIKQDSKCAICGADDCPTGRRLSVDHNHDTDEVRGLLCHDCNTGIGTLKDSPKLLKKAVKYLELHTA